MSKVHNHRGTIRNAKRLCKEDISLIDNYDQMLQDTSQKWCCHHRNEISEHKSKKQLIAEGRYYKVPAAELIFLTASEHSSLHMKALQTGSPMAEEHKKKISEAIKAALSRPDVKQKMCKQVDQYSLDGEYLRTWPSLRQAGKELGIFRNNICSCCKGKLKSAGGFVWKYHTDKENGYQTEVSRV